MKHIRNSKGYTIIELLTSLLITGIVCAAAFKFYVSMHNQTLAQEEISTMQQNSRVTIEEISKTLRMAGFKTGVHPAYAINGDSLYVFYSDTHPIDSVLFYLDDYNEYELSRFPEGIRPKKLMRRVNSDSAYVFSEYIFDLSFRAINSSTIEIAVEVISSTVDEDYAENNGYRTLAASENVNLRNVAL